MNNNEVVCPVCKNELSYANDGREKVRCVLCASCFSVERQSGILTYKVIEDGRKIIWASPLAWPEWKREIDHFGQEITILKLEREEKLQNLVDEKEKIELQRELDNEIDEKELDLRVLRERHQEK